MIGVVLLAAAVITGVLLLDRDATVGGSATGTTAAGTTDHSQATEPSRDRGSADALVGDCVKFNSVRLKDTLAQEIDCFTGYSTPDEWKAKVDCATADMVVSARLDDRVDPSVCPPTSGWQLVYPEPGRTICLDPVNGS